MYRQPRLTCGRLGRLGAGNPKPEHVNIKQACHAGGFHSVKGLRAYNAPSLAEGSWVFVARLWGFKTLSA